MTIIEFEQISKAYRLGTGQTSLREAIAQLAGKLFARNYRPADHELFWALDNVSFNVERGDVLGIIGHNGAGKSTILKLLSRVTRPTRGRIHTQGRMAALIELGAGFHPDLSGRENVYFNGSVLGLKRREINTEFSNIVEFAGLQKFIDTPVKRYSSGMYVRLAFAIAAHVKADLLLIDEVLSVGDTAFQQKCLAKMNELHRNGTTIVFVSHDLWTVQSFCKRVLLLRGGKIEADGSPAEVIDIYRQYERQDLLANTKSMTVPPDDLPSSAPGRADDTVITRIELLNTEGQPKRSLHFYDRLLVRVHYIAAKRIEAPLLLIRICRADGLVCCAVTNRNEPGFFHRTLEGEGIFEACLGPLPLVPDIYSVETLIVDNQQPIIYAASVRERFCIEGQLSGSNDAGVFAPNVEWFPEQRMVARVEV